MREDREEQFWMTAICLQFVLYLVITFSNLPQRDLSRHQPQTIRIHKAIRYLPLFSTLLCQTVRLGWSDIGIGVGCSTSLAVLFQPQACPPLSLRHKSPVKAVCKDLKFFWKKMFKCFLKLVTNHNFPLWFVIFYHQSKEQKTHSICTKTFQISNNISIAH